MLSEEALVLVAAFLACGLLVLGVLELMAPTRPRHPRRPVAARNPSPQARAAPSPAPTREARPPLVTPTPPVTASSPFLRPPAAAVEPPSGEPPIERLLRSQAASLEPPRRLQPPPRPPPPPPPSPPPPPRPLSPAASPPSPPPVAPPPPPPAPPPRLPVNDPLATPPPSDPPRWRPAPADVDSDVVEAGSVEIFEPPVAAAPPASAPAPAQPAPRPAVSSPSDRIYALWEGKQHALVESEATAALGRGGLSAGETARLWGLIGLARQEQGDVDGARGALEEAIMSAPAEDRAAWQRHMAQVALHAGQALLARVQVGSSDADERIDTLRAAIAWFESGITVGANDETLRDALRTARGALWPTYEEAANALLQRQEFHVARRLLQEAQADEDCPLPLQASFREMLAATFGGEVGQLTADAIRRMQEGKEEERLTDDGDRDGALLLCEKLWTFLKTAMERGMSKEELGPALGKTQQLFERLGKNKP